MCLPIQLKIDGHRVSWVLILEPIRYFKIVHLENIWPVSADGDLRFSKANQRNSQPAGILILCQFIAETGCLIAFCSDPRSAI